MNKLILYSIILLISFSAYSQPGFEWAQACGHPFYGETTTRLTTDADGNVFMAGSFIETAVFGTEMITAAGGADIYIAKHNAAGETLWLMRDGGEDYERLHGISVTNDAIFICGSFYGTTSIGTETYPSMGSQDIFLAGYDLEGNFSWARHMGSPKTDYVNALCTDPAGNIFITGYYYDSISFGDTTLYSLAASDIFIAKYSPSGERLWLEQAGGSSSDQSYSISCDDAGNILFTGSFFDDIQIGDTMLSTQDPTGIFLAKMDNDGELLYAMQADGNGLIAKSFAAFDNDGNIFFTGNFTDQVTFGTQTFDAGAFNIDIFITKYTPEGNLIWADHGYGIGSDQLISVSAGPKNDFYITGHYYADIFFGDLALPYNLCCGSSEIFIVRYTQDGLPVWGDSISGERGMVESMVKNTHDELFIAGMFQFQLSFGDMIIEGTEDYTNFLCGVATATMTSVAENSREEAFKVYPVPANDHLTIEVPQGTLVEYDLYDLYGRRLMGGKASGLHTLEISSIPAGQYLLRLVDMDKGISEGKMILKK